MLIVIATLFMLVPNDTYPRADLLIEPAVLAKSLKQFHVLDVRERAAYEEGHVPGAVSTSAAEWGKTFQDGKDVAGWTKRLSDLGITVDTKVVVYDDNNNKDAARVWWILKYWGVKDVRLLHGMWTGWKSAGSYAISREPVTPNAVTFVPDPRAERLARKQDMLNAVKTKELAIVDTRKAEEFTGKSKRAERGGCMPGATNLDFENLIDKKTQRFSSGLGTEGAVRGEPYRSEPSAGGALTQRRQFIGDELCNGTHGRQASAQLSRQLERMGQQPGHTDRHSEEVVPGRRRPHAREQVGSVVLPLSVIQRGMLLQRLRVTVRVKLSSPTFHRHSTSNSINTLPSLDRVCYNDVTEKLR